MPQDSDASGYEGRARAVTRRRLSRRTALASGLRFGLAAPMAAAFSVAEARGISAVPGRIERRATDEPLTVIVNINQWDLDPHTSGSDASLLFFGVYEMLLQLKDDSTDEFAPMLADSWEANPDNSSYTFRLSPTAVFHDGSPCDAAAVKASFSRFLGLGGAPVYIIDRFVQDPDQMVVVDEWTIRFDLDRPQPLFLAAMASAWAPFVVNPRVVEAHRTADDPWAHEWLARNTAGAGTGPYAVAEDRPNERTVLRRFDGYHRGWSGDHVADVVLRVVGENATRRLLLERGEADAVTRLLTPEDVAALAELPTLQVVDYDTLDVSWIAMNAPRLRTPEVRRGFSYAFPYDEVVEGVYRGQIKRSGPLAEGIRGYDPDVFLYQTDLTRAKELILSGGFREGDSFDYMYISGDAGSHAVAQLFQANVQAMGFTLELVEVDHAVQFDVLFGGLTAEERPVFFGSWGWFPDYNDPWNQLGPCFLRPASEGGEGVVNASLWSNERFEELMAEAKTYTDETRLAELMKEAQNILTEQDPPCIFIGQQRYATVLASDVRGFVGNPLYLNLYRYHQLYRAAD